MNHIKSYDLMSIAKEHGVTFECNIGENLWKVESDSKTYADREFADYLMKEGFSFIVIEGELFITPADFKDFAKRKRM